MEGTVEGALGAGLVAAESGEGLGVSAEDVAEAVAWGEVGVIRVDGPPVIDEADFEEAGFDSAEAGDAPLGHDDLVDEGGFEGAGGL